MIALDLLHYTESNVDQERHREQAEQQLRSICRAQHIVLVSSGTAALHCALAACSVTAGDEVILPGAAPSSVIMPILQLQAIPVLCDVDSTGTICPESASKRITHLTKVIIAVHQNGNVASLDRLRPSARSDIRIIEDCAQAIGSLGEHGPVGTGGDIAIFSFGSSKIISAGEGGAIATNDSALAAGARRFANLGCISHLQCDSVGLNYAPNPLAYPIISHRLSRLDEILERRENAARCVIRILTEVGFRCQETHRNVRRAYSKIGFFSPVTISRAGELDCRLKTHGIGYVGHPDPIFSIHPLISFYARLKRSLPSAETELPNSHYMATQMIFVRTAPNTCESSWDRLRSILSSLDR